MKVLMINSVCGYGSTGSICVDIATVLEEQGNECYIAYGQGSTTYPKSFKIGTVVENHLHNIGSRVTGKQGYFTTNGTKKLIRFIKEINPDVIHLHNLHGNYLNLEILFEYLIKVQKPVVWTLHDCWAFTGKCAHYTDVTCYKWQTQCNNCPQVQKYPPSLFFDQSEIMFTDKKKWFTALQNMTIIPVSHWLAGEVGKSFLNKYPTEPIYNWIDTQIFKPSEIKFVDEYRLDETKFSVIVVGAAWHIEDVKWQDLLELANKIEANVQIIVVGKIDKSDLLPKNCVPINYVHGKEKLAALYSFADAYVHLSTEDTFGKVIAEALSCGTPAVVYNSTACPEIIGEGCGYVVEKRNINLILEAINIIETNTKEFYSANCRNYVIKHYNYSTNINQTIAVYKNRITV